MLHEVTKEGDINYAKKLQDMIYIPQKKHPTLSSKVISYIQNCFSYAIKQYKNDLVFAKAIIQNIVPYCFGDNVN